MKTIRTYFSMMLLGVIVLISACSSPLRVEPSITVTPTETTVPLAATNIPARATTVPFIENLKPIQLTASAKAELHATALAIQETERAASQQTQNAQNTQIAEFSISCKDTYFHATRISPDGNWIAASCGSKSDQTLIVQSINGTQWVLDFKDFLSEQTPEDIMGAFDPLFWSPEGNYLFFTIQLGYDGGGDYCFPQDRGDYGLFRLNVKTGSWATLISSTDSFPGYEIEFSPTGRRYAITLGGVLITDLKTGESTKIKTDGVIEKLNWSSDGEYLAYSVATCDEQSVISSSTYVWDASSKQTQVLLEKDGMILKPEAWIDNSILRIVGEEIRDLDTFYTIYQYDIQQGSLVFTGTATPNP